jgi:hypothetical protein
MPLIYTGPADIVVNLKAVYRSGLPQDVASVGRDDEDAEAFAEMACLSEQTIQSQVRQSQISTASGPWLDIRGDERNTPRQFGEGDDPYRGRLIVPPTAGTADAIIAALDGLLGTDEVYLIQLPLEGVFGDADCYADGQDETSCLNSINRGAVIALIPESDEALLPAALAALRQRASAGKVVAVMTYTIG